MTQLLPPVPHFPVIIVGGGQAGLSMSYLLKERGIEHVIFEKNRMAEAWRSQRWDSFCLVTPNWQCDLPGFPYSGDDPKGFMKKDEIVRYIEAYAASFDPPLREGVTVSRLSRSDSGVFEISTSVGDFTADQVVVATGGYQTAVLPRMAERFPASIKQLHSSAYKSADDLPPGDVLIVGTGQSGCQIAEDLHLAGRGVHLCTGGAPRTARRYRGRDVVEWLSDMGYYKMTVNEHPMKEKVRDKTNHYVTGRDGGRDIDLRKFAQEGMHLYGRLNDVAGTTLKFGSDLKQNLDHADHVADSIKNTIDKYIDANGIEAPFEPRYVPVWEPAAEITELDYVRSGITSVIWSMGFGTNYRWIELPLFDGKGYPIHVRGITTVPGICFLGLPWQYTWGSGRFSGVAQDARFLAEAVASRHASTPVSAPKALNMHALGS